MGRCIYLRKGETHTAPINGILANTLAVGSTVKLMENNAAVEYLIVHQGLPSSIYDVSCDGTWLLRLNIYEKYPWGYSGRNDYSRSYPHTRLNDIFLPSMGAVEQATIKQVKIPYRTGGYENAKQGAEGLSTKVFLLSCPEVNFAVNAGEGAVLDYFSSCATSGADDKRIAYYNNRADDWYTRSPKINSSEYADYIFTDGDLYNSYYVTVEQGLRPALILPSDALFEKDTLILKGVA